MRKLILSIIAVVCCMTASADPQNVNGVYQLGSKEDLTWFANYVNTVNNTACAILTADITMNEGVLNSSGNLNSGSFEAWTPIGNDVELYFGEFNGNGHTISGLYFNDTSKNNVGLFGKVGNNAYIHDVGIKDSYFYGKDHVGGICGDFASGKIENCWNGAYVMAYDYDAGGISGSCYFNASIANCYNIGTVSTYEPKGGTQDPRFGGICGSVYSSSATYSIDNCYTLINNGGTEEDAAERAKLPYTNCNKIYGSLIDNCPPSKIHDSYVKKATDFISGEVCYRLNHGVTDGSQKWYQTLGDDPSPVLNNNRGTVYYGYDGDVLKYSNTTLTIPTTKHEQCAATCNAVGYTMECWEDTRSRKVYAEEACATELNAAYVVTYSPVMTKPEYDCNLAAWRWTMKDDPVTYDGVTFINALEKRYPESASYDSGEYVWFKVKDATAMNVRLKWHLNKNTFNGELYYKINDGDEIKIDIPENMWVQNLPDLKQDDIVTVYYKITYMSNISLNSPLIWTMSLEYCPGHSIEHVDAMAATCTEKGNYENWYCKKCDKHFANAECTTVMNDWEIPALNHNATHHEPKAATCTEDGNIDHWHCSNCNLNYREQTCTNQITDDVVLPKLNHKNKQHQDYTEATCLTDGNIEYWHCPDCSTYFTNEACTASTTDYIIAALGHDFTYTPYRTSTCTSEGDVEHWHCNRCEKDFNTGEEMASEDHVISGSLILPCKESDALVVGLDEGKTYDDCHTFTPPTEEGETTIATVTLGEGVISIKIKNGEETAYSLNETKPLETFFAHTFTLKANKDPEHTENYYSTFFTSERAYKLPAETAKAYIGEVKTGEKNDVLKLTDVGTIIHQSEAVILKATGSDITLMPSCNTGAPSYDNKLTGTENGIASAPANSYALSLGQKGVGFYLWEGKAIGANKAYLTLNASAGAKAFIFQFDDDPTGIEEASPISSPEGKDLMYDLNGVRVNESYKGIVIKNGKKIYQK